MTRARAARVQEEAIPHVVPSPLSCAQALLDYECDEPVVAVVEERAVDVVTFDDHEKVCEICRKANYALGGRGLVRLSRVMVARRHMNWFALCLVGKQFFLESWTALGLGLPEYAQ